MLAQILAPKLTLGDTIAQQLKFTHNNCEVFLFIKINAKDMKCKKLIKLYLLIQAD